MAVVSRIMFIDLSNYIRKSILFRTLNAPVGLCVFVPTGAGLDE